MCRSPTAADCATSSTCHAATVSPISKLTAQQQQQHPGSKYGAYSGSKVAVRASVDDAGCDVAAAGEEDIWNLCGWEEGPSVVSVAVVM
jgi:hypothetical protein